ncbi:MAG: DUF2878 domain-containing protein, partial [Shewanella sp.]
MKPRQGPSTPLTTGWIIYNALSFQLVWWASVLWLNQALLLTVPLLLLHFVLLVCSAKPRSAKPHSAEPHSALGHQQAAQDLEPKRPIPQISPQGLKAQWQDNVKADSRLMLHVAALGIAIDIGLMALGVFEFSVFPWWLCCLWLHFALSLKYSLAFMGALPLVVQALLGGIFGALSYVSGAQLDAVSLPYGALSSAIILFSV